MDEWASFEAAHIFPLSHEVLFANLNYARYITCFRVDMDGIDGRFQDPICRDSTDNRKATVLANTKGAGEPIFEFDFPDGSDMVGEIVSGPRGADRMEAELFSRLNSVYLVS
ncbi:hypothetical protein V1517DRAFT_368335 [Lipomyces orientalis]|uniref:Uncharacterized protein n=1 Tax=Lipomyces orientalis TaxID=1233043 RepID=A0ACC3TKT2_9ASCO